jgi:uncharacterized protein (DUF1778 family)
MIAPSKPERLEARVTQEQKKLIERAAKLEGRTITDFLVTSAQAAARSVIHEREILTLSSRGRKVFIDAILNPREPNEKLRRAARLYNKTFR